MFCHMYIYIYIYNCHLASSWYCFNFCAKRQVLLLFCVLCFYRVTIIAPVGLSPHDP
jgi:hypothetical protein